MDELYREHILEHYRHPHNKGVLPRADATARVANPVCGDKVEMYVSFDGKGNVGDISFDGESCAVSTASASLLTDCAKGKAIQTLKVMTPGDVYTLLGTTLNPARTACALLPYRAMLDALHENEKEKGKARPSVTKPL
ncbi:MAG: iron-sulfur cluster assembly scaffold protein [Patescibacteria group bacterium]|mgnify:CR=1 FL=1